VVVPPIAHAAHWFEGLLYLAPLVIVIVVLALQSRREERAGRAETDRRR
jgi:hypothetical protein